MQPQPNSDQCCEDRDGDVNTLTYLSSIIGRSCRQYNFCRNKHLFVATKHLLTQQKYICHDKTFVATILLRKKYCRNKLTFVMTNMFDKTCLLL